MLVIRACCSDLPAVCDKPGPNHTAFHASEIVTLLLDSVKMAKHNGNTVTLCMKSVTKLLRRKP